jgi:hypothetical protein
MCARKETDVRESPNNSNFAGRERQGSRGETCYAMFDKNPVSSLPQCGALCWTLSTVIQGAFKF